MSQDSRHHLPTLQAPVKALDPHGVQIVSLGTGLFVIGAVVCWLSLPALEAIDKTWWFSTALVGTGIGIVALVVLMMLRRRRLQ